MLYFQILHSKEKVTNFPKVLSMAILTKGTPSAR